MIDPQDVNDLLASRRRDVLSVSLDVDPTKPEHQTPTPAYRIWCRNALRDVLEQMPRERRLELEETGQRVLVRLNDPIQGRGLVIFAAPGLWREYAIPFPLANRLQYGEPDLLPLLWAMDEYEPYAILAVTREQARVIVAYLGQTTVVEHEVLALDTTSWRFTSGRPPTSTRRMGTGAARGAQRETFEARVDEQVVRFWQRAADAAARAMRNLRVDRLIVAGPQEDIAAVRALLPADIETKVVSTIHLPPGVGLPEIRDLTMPAALTEEHNRELALVGDLLERTGNRTGAVVGVAATLPALRAGRVHTVIADVASDRAVWACARCGYLSAAETEVCPECGAPLARSSLLHMLPLLARRTDAVLELVSGEAAQALRQHDGIGAILRYQAQPRPT